MSTVVLDTITGKSTATTITIGSTPVVSASATSMTIRGEGSAQTSIQQGLSKAWFNFEQAGPSIEDSFNTSSITDTSASIFTNVFSTNMANTVWAGALTSRNLHQQFNTDAAATTGRAIRASNASNAVGDTTANCMICMGDLA